MALEKLIKCGPSNIGARREKDIYALISQYPERLEFLLNAKYKKAYPTISNLKEKADYLFREEETGIDIYVEVKPWEVKIKDMLQLFRYYIHLLEKKDNGDLLGEKHPFKICVICATVNPTRQNILKRLGIRIILLKEIFKIY